MNFGKNNGVLNFQKKAFSREPLTNEAEMVGDEAESKTDIKSTGFDSDKNSKKIDK